MKMPQKPPAWTEISRQNNISELISITNTVSGPTYNGRYLHWDKLRYLPPPEGLSSEQWWFGLKLRRKWGLLKAISLKDAQGVPFQYGLPDSVLEFLHQIDQGAGSLIGAQDQITNPDTRDRYIMSSLVEEAIRSSQLEGAVTTRQVAKEMIRAKRPPRDRSEQMIFNNFTTMQKIRQLRDQELTPEIIFELHRIVTDKTLDDPAAAGRLRRAEEAVRIEDNYGEVFHYPPSADQLENRITTMCDFANGKIREGFIHPVIRAIILHFWLAYDHPFVDGNGRCGRALFYWAMLRHGYWLCEYLSISQIIHKAPIKYYRAFLYTETDENDLTYFIMYHLDVLTKAIQELHHYIQRKTEELKDVENQIRSTVHFNPRQQALISYALRHPNAEYSIESHRASHGVVYETARTDLMGLEKKGLLVSRKIGRTWYFYPADHLEKRLSALK